MILISGLNTTTLLYGEWKTVKNDSFTVFYPSGNEIRALEVLGLLEFYRKTVEELTGNSSKSLSVVLEDPGAMSNGYADPLFHRVHLFTYPPSSGELGFTQNWWSLVGVHEYTHLLHLTNSGGFPSFLTFLFGSYLSPNIFQPGWMSEGIAVYSESRLSPFSGRLNDGTYDAYLGALVREDRFPSLVEATYAPLSFPGGRGVYLFGGTFFDYLSGAYGEESFSRFFKSFGSSILSYLSPFIPALGIDRTAGEIYGKSFPELWKEYRAAAEERFKDSYQEGEPVTDHGWYVEDPLVLDGKLFFKRSYPVKTASFLERWRYELIELDLYTGKESTLVSSPSPFTSRLVSREGKLYYATLDLKPGFANYQYNSYGFCSVLHEYDPAAGRDRSVFRELIRGFTVITGGEILFSRDREDTFGSRLYRLKRGDGETPELLFETDYLIREILADENGLLYLSARRDRQSFSLYTLDLNGLDLRARTGRSPDRESGTLNPLLESSYSEGGLYLSGEKLFFSANYGGIYSIFCYDLEENRLSGLTDSGYASSPAYDRESGRLYFVGLGSEGYDIYRKKARFQETQVPDYTAHPDRDNTSPAFSLPADPQPAYSLSAGTQPVAVPPGLPENEIRRGGYFDNLLTLFPKVFYPVFSAVITPDFSLVDIMAGAGIMGVSALGDFQYTLDGMYNFTGKRPEVEFFLNTLVLSPLLFSVRFSTMGWKSLEASLEAVLELPLYKSLSAGFSSLSLGLSGEIFRDDFSRKQIEPFLKAGFLYPYLQLSMFFGFPFERKELGSSMDLFALVLGTILTKQLWNTEVKLGMTGVYDLGASYWVLPVLRGYGTGLICRAGAVLSLDYSIPLFKIRKGLWNPALFLGDFFINPFFDFALNDNLEYRFAGGLEIHQEIKGLALAAGVPIDLSAGVAVNREGVWSLRFALRAAVGEGFFSRNKPRRM